MAKLFIRGVGEVSISNDKAKKFKDQWYQGLLKGRKIDLGDIVFNGDAITAVKLDAEITQYDQYEYDLNDPAQKAKVKTFEKEFLEWINLEGGKYIPGEKFNYFLQGKGAIKITGAYFQYSVKDIQLFKELNKLFSSLNTLRRLRTKAESYNDPDYEAKNIKRLAEIKKGVIAGFPKPNPALAQLTADAKEFDRQNDMEEIDPTKIPY